MTWWQYVEQTAPGRTQEQIARQVGVSAATITRWRASEPKPANVAAFARAYSRPVLEAFVAAGFLTPEDAAIQVTVTRYEDPSDDELIELITRRLRSDREDVSDHDRDAAPIAAPPVTRAHAVVIDVPPEPA